MLAAVGELEARTNHEIPDRGRHEDLAGPIVTDPEGIITGGHDNKTGRAIAVPQGEKINTKAPLAMFRQIMANNRAGGWRKLKG